MLRVPRRAASKVRRERRRLIEHDGDDGHEVGPDHSFVAWRARGDTSAYAGGLWLAALRAGAGLARDLNETHARDSLEQTMRAAAVAHDAALWLGDDDGGRGYYRFDASGTEGATCRPRRRSWASGRSR